MPGFILHLTAAQMLRSHLHEYPDFPYPIQSVNDFLIGNLLPDATDQKELSHFRNPVYRDKMMVFPDLTRFTAKYDSLLSDSSVLGYYFHVSRLLLISPTASANVSSSLCVVSREILIRSVPYLPLPIASWINGAQCRPVLIII